MTRSELASFDGREGRRAYAAVNGKVYDFTDSPRWKDGDHEKRHRAGCDLTQELQGAPHIRSVIERFPVVGVLDETAPPAGKGRKALAVGVIVLVLIVVLFLLLR